VSVDAPKRTATVHYHLRTVRVSVLCACVESSSRKCKRFPLPFIDVILGRTQLWDVLNGSSQPTVFADQQRKGREGGGQRNKQKNEAHIHTHIHIT
jgi:hypothetical protein